MVLEQSKRTLEQVTQSPTLRQELERNQDPEQDATGMPCATPADPGAPSGPSRARIWRTPRPVMAVADLCDALISRRPLERAVIRIEAGSGSHFDPTVVSAFLIEA